MNFSLPAWLEPIVQQLEPWFPLLTLIGTAMALASFIAIPWLLIRMPHDYFTRGYKPRQHRGVMAWLVWAGRNFLAVILLIAGILMLVLPGQGLLTILIAIMTSTFPGKYRLERAIIRRPHVYHGVNWIREKYHRPALDYPDGQQGDASDAD
ncbi:MAG: hypothetical protein R3292_08605 [Alcanivorax sp.]|nr:hypothetical protein [Alcanivorax sp.]